MTETWGLLPLKEIESFQTQAIWHAAALTREAFDYNNVLFIDWPDKPFVSVGFHQDPNEELDMNYCDEQGYEVYRRACGGGQVFLDGDQIFYHMITDVNNEQLKGPMGHFYEKLLAPVVTTYNELGLEAEYAPINDIVVGSKKVSGNGAATHGNSRILTGNFILSFPSKEMSKVLRVPDEKFRDKIAQSLDERVGSFMSINGSRPDTDTLISKFTKNFEESMDAKLVETTLPQATSDIMNEFRSIYNTDEWKYEVGKRSSNLRAVKIKGDSFVSEATHKAPGGLLKGIIVTDNNVISDATLYGDISVDPMDGLTILEKSLVGVSTDTSSLTSVITSTLSNMDMPGVSVSDLVELVSKAALSHAESR
ncbi:MAG: lipoate--protein ligase family protein [Candidatus Kariarchaeaceae archaeon]|jgi:lipoate-protein ligase A